MPDGLRLALTTLTVVPVRGPASLDRRTAGTAMELAPLVGVGLGLVGGGVLVGFDALATPLLAAALTVGTLAALTRGLHLDGLADLADGLGSYRDPAGARAVMKRPDVGALGLVTVVVTLLVQVAALGGCLTAGRGGPALVLSVGLGRVAVVLACRGTPAATPEGLGALVAGTVRGQVAAGWVAVALLGSLAPAVLDGPVAAVQPVLAVVLALLSGRLLLRHAVRRVGGLTGDVLGALVEVTTTVSLVVLAVRVP